MTLRIVALVVVILCAIAALAADSIAPAGPTQQMREMPNSAPSAPYFLGTDELGRDRLARLLHGMRVSLLLAPATALLALTLAVGLGSAAAVFGGAFDRAVLALTDVVGSVPLLFLLISLRAVLPLDIEAAASIAMTFALLGVCGWTTAMRAVRAAVLELRASDATRQAAALGIRPVRMILVHIRAGVRPVLTAQFWLLVPQFLMAEANLGALGLGITEPVPSLGNLLADLQNVSAVTEQPWRIAPAIILVLLLGCFQLVFREGEKTC